MDTIMDFSIILNYVILNYFQVFSCIYFIDDQSNIDFNTDAPIIILNNSHMWNYFDTVKCEGFIIISDQIAEHVISIEEQLRILKVNRYTRRKYFLLSTKYVDIKTIFELRNFKFIMDATLVLPQYNSSCSGGIKDEHCECYDFWTHKYMSVDAPIRLYSWCTNVDFGYGGLYPDKMKAQENKEMFISAVDYKPFVNMDTGRGMEILIVETFCELYKFSHKYSWDEWGSVFTDNMTFTGSKNHTMRGFTDLTIGSTYALTERYQFYQISSVATSHSGLAFMVPHPSLEAGLATPFRPFSSTTWAAFFGFFLILAVINFIILHFYARIYSFIKVSFARAILPIFGILLQQQVRITARLFGIPLLFYGMIFIAFYSSGLSSRTSKPVYQNEIKSISDLEHSNISIIGLTISDFEKVRNDKRYKSICERFTEVPKDIIKSVLKESKDSALAIEHPLTGYSLGAYENYLTVEDIEHLRVVKEDMSYERCVILGYKHSVLFPYLDQHLLHVKEAGLDHYWITEAFEDMDHKFRVYFRYEFSHTYVKLSWRGIEGAVGVLIIGLVIASLQFVCEISRKYLKHHLSRMQHQWLR